ncbi:GDSL-type esterase/lipase family protein [Frondihabitans sp. PhB188]|uniref:GDSL-type esterase/lipase family protein n=1 Tax=Frondihabitans sp. PhB188 TaxID=2485200 RepID=UPI000F49ECBA|nr:GDSL-type esterase/lipase family protein [Frondihabitans sp. PhB188]
MPFSRSLLRRLVRPVLLAHFAIYRRTIAAGIFPTVAAERVVDGEDPIRMLFVGDIAVSGYGVLDESMAVPAQVAGCVGARTGRGVAWDVVTDPSLTISEAAQHAVVTPGTDVVVVLLGIPDVLLGTDDERWRRSLRAIVGSARQAAGTSTRVAIAGVPPMQDFRPIQPSGRALISAQVARLNAVSAAVADEMGADFVPFPDWRITEMYIEDAFSFRAMHRMWAQAIAPALVGATAEV